MEDIVIMRLQILKELIKNKHVLIPLLALFYCNEKKRRNTYFVFSTSPSMIYVLFYITSKKLGNIVEGAFFES